MAAEYSVVQTDFKTGAVVARLPIAALSFTHTLNASGSATVTIPLFAPEADPESLSPGVSGLAVLRDGVPVWGGALWGLSADIAAGTLALSASGFHSHYKGRYFLEGWHMRDREQSELLRWWFSYHNAQNGIGTEVSLAPTGVKRTAIWTRYELKSVAEAIEEMADNVNGFNFRYVPYWAEPGKRIGHRFVTAPRSGGAAKHSLAHRVNCDVTRVSYDSAALCTTAYVSGADAGNGEKLIGIAESRVASARMAQRVMVGTYPDVKESRTLIDRAWATINAGSVPVAIPELTLYPGHARPQDVVPGDVAATRVDAGYVALYEEFVITECATTVDTTGGESVSLALASKELWSNANAS
ncbi:hypothetical protein [Streptomyces sp. CC224B]|uniref:hypothetical protein n=1 Tax=Streptomyces sp. CC224B TaxID=3044571 RepID=UPI0024A9B2C2|nr:hypothetical protein [Streptomyces sp. CC224B]